VWNLNLNKEKRRNASANEQTVARVSG